MCDPLIQDTAMINHLTCNYEATIIQDGSELTLFIIIELLSFLRYELISNKIFKCRIGVMITPITVKSRDLELSLPRHKITWLQLFYCIYLINITATI